jgi:hypothetical protein
VNIKTKIADRFLGLEARETPAHGPRKRHSKEFRENEKILFENATLI